MRPTVTPMTIDELSALTLDLAESLWKHPLNGNMIRDTIENVLRRHPCERASNTPNHLLAKHLVDCIENSNRIYPRQDSKELAVYLVTCLESFHEIVNARDRWHD